MSIPSNLSAALFGNITVGDSNYFPLGGDPWDTNLVTVPAGQGAVGMAFFKKTTSQDSRVALALYSTYNDGRGGQWNYPPMCYDSNFTSGTTVDCGPVSFMASTAPIITGAAFKKLSDGSIGIAFLLADGQTYNNTSSVNAQLIEGHGYIDMTPLGSPYINRPGVPFFGGGGIGVLDNRFLPCIYLGGTMAFPSPPVCVEG